MRIPFLILLSFLLSSAPSIGLAASDKTLCRNAAIAAETRYNIPSGLLQAVAIVESGKAIEGKKTAWPWTVNIAGKGHYFKNKKEAIKFVRRKQKAGVVSLDIGCFQINTKWHGQNFDSVEKMFDPSSAAAYASSFLNDLKAEFSSWRAAVERYHSRTRKHSDKYGSKIYATLQKIKPTENKPLISQTPSAKPLVSQYAGGVELAIFQPSNSIITQRSTSLFILDEE